MFSHNRLLWNLTVTRGRWGSWAGLGTDIIMLSRISGDPIPQEARPTTTIHNLVWSIRVIRYKFLGSILRSDRNHLVYRVVSHKYTSYERGIILMDSPLHTSLMDLIPPKLWVTDKSINREHWITNPVLIETLKLLINWNYDWFKLNWLIDTSCN